MEPEAAIAALLRAPLGMNWCRVERQDNRRLEGTRLLDTAVAL
jgi:hypothetical protein